MICSCAFLYIFYVVGAHSKVDNVIVSLFGLRTAFSPLGSVASNSKHASCRTHGGEIHGYHKFGMLMMATFHVL